MRMESIGNCTLYLGDALDIVPTLQAGSIDLVVSDPPYMINSKSDGQGKLSPWADMTNGSRFVAEWIGASRVKLSQTGGLWSFTNWRSLVTMQKASCDLRWPIESMLVWNKQWIGPGGQKGLRPSYELVALFAQPDFAIDDRGLPDIKNCLWSSIKPNGHPAEKPVELLRWLIDISTPTKAVVADWFMGSGSSGVAAVQLGRPFIGIEMDEAWFDVACRRISEASRDLFVDAPIPIDPAEQRAMEFFQEPTS